MKWQMTLSAILLFGVAGIARGQVVPYTLQEGVEVNLYSFEAEKILSPDEFWVTYAFHNLYDSCRVVYWFTELKQGDMRLAIDYWVRDRYEKEKNAEDLSAISRSKSFTVTGENVSYCHAVEWFDHRPDKRIRLVDNFYCPDTLTYTIRAVNETTGDRQILERLTVRSNDGRMWASGALPIALVEWKPPTSWTGQTAYIDIQLGVEGPGLFNPARSDEITGPLSVQLEEPYYSEYYEQFNQSYPPSGTVK